MGTSYKEVSEEVGRIHVSCTLIAFFDFGISHDRQQLVKNSGDRWGSLDIQIVLCVSFKAMYFVL